MNRKFVLAGFSAVSFLLLGRLPALAAAGTDCICRTQDGKRFEGRTLRHSRWACDVKLGYLRDPETKDSKSRRPVTETCNIEEIHQYKVWICMQNGCTYGYAKSQKARNKGLERIEILKGERRP